MSQIFKEFTFRGFNWLHLWNDLTLIILTNSHLLRIWVLAGAILQISSWFKATFVSFIMISFLVIVWITPSLFFGKILIISWLVISTKLLLLWRIHIWRILLIAWSHRTHTVLGHTKWLLLGRHTKTWHHLLIKWHILRLHHRVCHIIVRHLIRHHSHIVEWLLKLVWLLSPLRLLHTIWILLLLGPWLSWI